MSEVSKMKGYAIAIGVLSVVILMTLAVIAGFKDTGLVDNTTADKFITGLAIFGTFIGVIVLALVGKVVINLFNKK